MLELNDVSHRYAEQQTLSDVSLSMGKGDIACILGPSGCGKTTLLRCVAGFEEVSSGQISIAGSAVASGNAHVPPEKRRVGMVFQDYALLPHLTALRNVMFGLHRYAKAEAELIAQETLAKVGLEAFAERYPHELSGGQQQRVAIARAVAPKPQLLLMDEPFSNIDASMRSDLGQQLKALLLELGTTTLVATHDHQDAFALGDRLAVMRDGKVLQWSSAYDVYHQPNDRFVANFVGEGVWLPGNVVSDREVDTELGKATGTMTQSFDPGSRVDVFLRPDDVVHDDDSELQVEVLGRRFRGSEFIYELRLPGGDTVLSMVPSHHDHAPGEKIGIRLETDHMVVFPREA